MPKAPSAWIGHLLRQCACAAGARLRAFTRKRGGDCSLSLDSMSWGQIDRERGLETQALNLLVSLRQKGSFAEKPVAYFFFFFGTALHGTGAGTHRRMGVRGTVQCSTVRYSNSSQAAKSYSCAAKCLYETEPRRLFAFTFLTPAHPIPVPRLPLLPGKPPRDFYHPRPSVSEERKRKKEKKKPQPKLYLKQRVLRAFGTALTFCATGSPVLGSSPAGRRECTATEKGDRHGANHKQAAGWAIACLLFFFLFFFFFVAQVGKRLPKGGDRTFQLLLFLLS